MKEAHFLYIMTPAMILSWFFGLLLISKIGFDQLNSLWFQLKLIFVVLLTVYHSENSNLIITNVFKTMERKLFYYIMTPAMVLSWLFGMGLIHEIGFLSIKFDWLI